ncbi:MAG: XdhC family protein [Desulfobacterium sp.]
MKTILSDIITLLNDDVDFAVATILDTPRTAGTKMAILSDGTIRGTIGGGLVEAQVMEMGKKIISLGRNILMEFKLHQDLKESLDMICGGELRVLIETITRKKRSLYTHIAMRNNKGVQKNCTNCCKWQDINFFLLMHQIIASMMGTIQNTNRKKFSSMHLPSCYWAFLFPYVKINALEGFLCSPSDKNISVLNFSPYSFL